MGSSLTSYHFLVLIALVPQMCSLQLIQLQYVKGLTVCSVVMGLSTSYRAHLQILNMVCFCCVLDVFIGVLTL